MPLPALNASTPRQPNSEVAIRRAANIDHRRIAVGENLLNDGPGEFFFVGSTDDFRGVTAEKRLADVCPFLRRNGPAGATRSPVFTVDAPCGPNRQANALRSPVPEEIPNRSGKHLP